MVEDPAAARPGRAVVVHLAEVEGKLPPLAIPPAPSAGPPVERLSSTRLRSAPGGPPGGAALVVPLAMPPPPPPLLLWSTRLSLSVSVPPWFSIPPPPPPRHVLWSTRVAFRVNAPIGPSGRPRSRWRCHRHP